MEYKCFEKQKVGQLGMEEKAEQEPERQEEGEDRVTLRRARQSGGGVANVGLRARRRKGPPEPQKDAGTCTNPSQQE